MGFISAYGYGGYYGEFKYKGVFDPYNSLRGLAWSDEQKCFHYGFTDNQGHGWDEVQDGDWVWPENQACVLTVVDSYGHQDLIVFDEASGLPYVINTRDGPSGSGMTTVWKDKVDDNVSGSGTVIATSMKLPEHYGEKMGYDMWHEQSRIHARPVKNDNRGASGFTATGLPSDIEFTSKYYADGDTTVDCTMSDVALTSEYVHDRKVKGNTLQQEIVTNVSNFKVIKTESIYKVSDVQKIPSIGSNTEAAYELEFVAPTIWLSRSETQLRNRADNSTLTGTVSATTGPDGLSNSAMTVTTISLANSAIAAGTIMLWATTAYTISGVTLASHATTATYDGTTWYLRYVTGAIPASLTLGAGTLFDIRVYSTEISSAALSHYADNVANFAGRAYLPVTG